MKKEMESMDEASDVATDFRVGGRGDDLKNNLP